MNNLDAMKILSWIKDLAEDFIIDISDRFDDHEVDIEMADFLHHAWSSLLEVGDILETERESVI